MITYRNLQRRKKTWCAHQKCQLLFLVLLSTVFVTAILWNVQKAISGFGVISHHHYDLSMIRHKTRGTSIYRTMPQDMKESSSHTENLGLRGYYTFDETEACRNSNDPSSPSTTSQTTQPCIIKYPYVDLQQYIADNDEAYAVGIGRQKHLFKKVVHNSASEPSSFSSSYSSIFDDKKFVLPYPLLDANSAVLTRCGYKGGPIEHQVNQDSIVLISPYYPTSLASGSVAQGFDWYDKDSLLMGIFDGHGNLGHLVSRYASIEFPKVFSNLLEQELKGKSSSDVAMLNQDEIIKKTFKKAYHIVDDNLPTLTETAGCTASVILQLGQKIYLANAGDSQSFIVSYSASTETIKILHQTRQDKPDLPDERTRIESMGGQIQIPPPPPPGQKPYTSRVIIPVSPIQQFSLAMSRSIGDHEGRAVGVIADPLVDSIDLMNIKNGHDGHEELFAFVASDGLLDYVEPSDVAKKVALLMYNSHQVDGMALIKACEELIMKSSEQWIATNPSMAYRDDISIAVSKIHLSKT